MKTLKVTDIVAAVLLVIGGLNWLAVGLFQYDVVAAIFGGSGMIIARIVYTLVGVAAVYQIVEFRAIQRRWAGRKTPQTPQTPHPA